VARLPVLESWVGMMSSLPPRAIRESGHCFTFLLSYPERVREVLRCDGTTHFEAVEVGGWARCRSMVAPRRRTELAVGAAA
jgi:hypothetical protein